MSYLVLIDCQRDFYHPEGAYGRHGRPLGPLQETMGYLSRLVERLSFPVIGLRSHYQPNQFVDMPRLCRAGQWGSSWHPEIPVDRLLTKHQHSGAGELASELPPGEQVYLGGVCTHRCVRKTLRDLVANTDLRPKVLPNGVGSCGLRRERHKSCLARWDERNLLGSPLPEAPTSPKPKSAQLTVKP